MKIIKTGKGITIVALIITIIILLILAVVTIQAVQGDGIIAHAKNARDSYSEAQRSEQDALDKYLEKLEEDKAATTIAEAQSNGMLSKTVNSKIKDKYENKITVPAGFKILVDNTTGYTAETIDVTKGIVIQDASGNEFVWVPVGNIKTSESDGAGINITLGRYSWDGNTGKLEQPIAENTTKSPTSEVAIATGNNNYTEIQPTTNGGNAIAKNINDFYNSSIQNGGYYIGRYEAGDSSRTTARTSVSETGTLVCKANQEVYNYITQPDASSKCQSMYSSGNFTSDLVNSYAWDTAIIFIQTFGGADASTYASANKCNGFKKTGANQEGDVPDKYCNIYDLSGNTCEWTTEMCSDADGPCTQRGGYFNIELSQAGLCTNYRYKFATHSGYSSNGFRPLLYVAQK